MRVTVVTIRNEFKTLLLSASLVEKNKLNSRQKTKSQHRKKSACMKIRISL